MGNPVRRSKVRTRGVRGRFYSHKAGRLVRYESLNEKYLFKVLETDPYVISYCEQPIELEYAFNSKKGTYTPDVLATRIDQTKTLYEAKSQEELDKNDPRLEAKLLAARNYCENQGWDFTVVTEAIRTSAEYMRADILWPHLMHPGLDGERLANLLARFEDDALIAFSDLCPGLNWHDENYSYVLHLIGRGQLYETPNGVFDRNTMIGVFNG